MLDDMTSERNGITRLESHTAKGQVSWLRLEKLQSERTLRSMLYQYSNVPLLALMCIERHLASTLQAGQRHHLFLTPLHHVDCHHHSRMLLST